MTIRMMTDEDMIKGCLRKDIRAQEFFYHRFAGKMFGVCLRYASNHMDAEDILQEGFLRAYNHLHQFRFQGSIDGWIRKIIIHTAINFYKKQLIIHQHEVDLEKAGEYATISEDALSQLSRGDLLKVIQRLPVGYRTVFNLFIIEGYSHKEIALMLGISENTSKSQLFRAKHAVQQELAGLS